MTLRYSAQSVWITNLKRFISSGNAVDPIPIAADATTTEAGGASAPSQTKHCAEMYKVFLQADDLAIDYMPASGSQRIIMEMTRLSMNTQIVEGAPMQRYKVNAHEVAVKLSNGGWQANGFGGG